MSRSASMAPAGWPAASQSSPAVPLRIQAPVPQAGVIGLRTQDVAVLLDRQVFFRELRLPHPDEVDQHGSAFVVERQGILVISFPDHVRCRPAGEHLHGAVPGDHHPVAIDHPGRVRQEVDDLGQTLLGVPDSFLGLLAFGDVGKSDHCADDPALPVNGVGGVLGVESRAVLAPEHLLGDAVDLAVGEGRPHGAALGRVGAAVGAAVMNEVVDGFADELAVAETEHALGGVVDEGRPALLVDPDDAVAGRVQGETGALLGLAPQHGLARQLAVPNDDHRQDGGDDDEDRPHDAAHQAPVHRALEAHVDPAVDDFGLLGVGDGAEGPVQGRDQLRPVGPHGERKAQLVRGRRGHLQVFQPQLLGGVRDGDHVADERVDPALRHLGDGLLDGVDQDPAAIGVVLLEVLLGGVARDHPDPLGCEVLEAGDEGGVLACQDHDRGRQVRLREEQLLLAHGRDGAERDHVQPAVQHHLQGLGPIDIGGRFHVDPEQVVDPAHVIRADARVRMQLVEEFQRRARGIHPQSDLPVAAQPGAVLGRQVHEGRGRPGRRGLGAARRRGDEQQQEDQGADPAGGVRAAPARRHHGAGRNGRQHEQRPLSIGLSGVSR